MSTLDLRVFTPESLAASWGEPWTPARVRRLCREGHIPARKAGPKNWLIPAVGLADWARDIATQPQPVAPAPSPAKTALPMISLPRRKPGRKPEKVAW
jgi:hypothetical protein